MLEHSVISLFPYLEYDGNSGKLSEAASYRGIKTIPKSSKVSGYKKSWYLILSKSLDVKLPYDLSCPLVGRSVCHNFLKGRREVTTHATTLALVIQVFQIKA